MPSHKVLKSIAHNLGHSFLSPMNYGLDDYVVEHLFKAARAADKPYICIDLLNGVIEPPELRKPAIQEAVARYRAWLPRMVLSQGSSPEFVRSARIDVCFDFSKVHPYRFVPQLTAPVYEAVVRIVDDRGKEYESKIPEWWRYEAAPGERQATDENVA